MLRPLTLTLLSLSLALGCDSDDSESEPTSDAGMEQDARVIMPADSGPPIDGGQLPDANPDAPDPTCEGRWVREVSGRVLDEDGAGLSGALAQMCIRLSPGGRLECLRPSTVQDTGDFQIEIPPGKECMESASMRVIKPNTPYATSYCTVTLDQARVEIPDPIILFNVSPALDRPPEGDPDEARRVVLPDDFELEITPGAMYTSGSAGYDQMAGRALRADADGICHQIDRPDLTGIYLISPEADVTREGAGFPFQMALIAPDETTADLYILGGLDCHLSDGEEVPEAAWRRFGAATVQGNQLIADAANGVPCFGWIGYKLNLE